MVEIINSLQWWDYFAIFLILFFGLPHGAFDAAVGMTIGLYDNNRNKFIFLISYALSSILVIALWYFFPQYLFNFIFTS